MSEWPAESFPKRQTEDLRKSRISLAGSAYFVTFGTAQRAPILVSPAAIQSAHLNCRRLVQDGDIDSLTATVMPDHVHLLFRLGTKITLARVVAKWRALVGRSVPNLQWQANFFEHRLRADEATEPYARYIFMNPYRADLIACDSAWPGWWTDGQVAYAFLTQTRPGPCPQPEWIDQMMKQTHDVVTGE